MNWTALNLACAILNAAILCVLVVRRVRSWLAARRGTLRGENLTIFARYLFGLERLPGESDRALRARCNVIMTNMRGGRV